MNTIKENFRQRATAFYRGRYGQVDKLNRFLVTTSVILMITSLLSQWTWLNLLALAILLWSNFRILSKKIYKRSDENQTFIRLSRKILRPFRFQQQKWVHRKEYRLFRCKNCNCSQTIRVPKGRGTVRITCPHCQTQFQKKV